MKAKKITALLLSLALMLTVVGCTSENSDVPPESTSTPSSEVSEPSGDHTPQNTHINVAENFGFDLFHTIITPSNTAAGYGFTYYLSNTYDTLVTYNEQGELVAALAETWDMSEDGTVYTFNLREDVKFSDGSDFTSEDVVASLKGAPVNLGQYNGSYGMLSTIIKDAVAVDETTVELHLTQPYYSTLRDLCLPNPFGIVSSEQLNDDLTMITTGDYGVTNFQTQGGYYDPTSVITNMNPSTSMDPLMMQMNNFLPNGSELIIEVNTATDENRIAEIYETVIGTMSENCFNTPLYYTRQIALYGNGISNYVFEQDANYLSVQNIELN